MDDWEAPDRPTPGGEQYGAADDPNVEGRFVLLLFVVAALAFGIVCSPIATSKRSASEGYSGSLGDGGETGRPCTDRVVGEALSDRDSCRSVSRL